MTTRRQALSHTLRAAAALCVTPAGLASCSGRGAGSAVVPGFARVDAPPAFSTTRAYAFLYRMMDEYFSGSKLRLLQSFVPTSALNLGDLGFTHASVKPRRSGQEYKGLGAERLQKCYGVLS
jgi:hypothetical protein